MSYTVFAVLIVVALAGVYFVKFRKGKTEVNKSPGKGGGNKDE